MLFHLHKKPSELHIVHLNQVQEKHQQALQKVLKTGSANKKCCFKSLCKKKTAKADDKTSENSEQTVFVLDFDGDIKASAVDQFREEITAVIAIAKAGDEVVVRLESGGGQVNSYGLAAAQLARIKEAGLSLTVTVDKVAASGGYMMACVADKVLASDFAIVGSVGVISQLPNFHELLKKHDIAFETFTAGEYKRTVTMFGENDDKDRAKHQEDIDRIHELFKTFVKKHRPGLDVEKIATGEFWFGTDALALGLVDEIGTSDAYILSLMKSHQVFALNTRTKPTLAEKLGLSEQLSAGVQKLAQLGADSVIQLGQKIKTPRVY